MNTRESSKSVLESNDPAWKRLPLQAISRAFVLMVLMSGVSQVWAGTEISGVFSDSTVLTLDGSPYEMTNDVAVNYLTALTIEPGVVIHGHGYSLAIFGQLLAMGTARAPIRFERVNLLAISPDPTQPASLYLQSCQFMSGAIQAPFPVSIFASLVLRDSYFQNVTGFMLSYPAADCHIERNIFVNCDGFQIYTDQGKTVYMTNNVFYQQSTPYAIEDFESKDTSGVVVDHNSFLSADRVAVRLCCTDTPSTAKLSAINNYWNTPDISVIAKMVYDRNANPALPDAIPYIPLLFSPDAKTPVLGPLNPTPVISAIGPSWIATGSADFVLTVEGSSFLKSSIVTWNGTPRPTTFVSDKQLTAAISAADVSAVGTADVSVFTTVPGGGSSDSLQFSINPPGNEPTIVTFSQFAVGGGYESTLLLTNKSAAPISLAIRLRQGAGLNWIGQIGINGTDMTGKDEYRVDLLPFATQKLTLTGDATTESGYLQVVELTSVGAVTTTYFYNYYANGQLQFSVGAPPSQASTKFIFAVEKGSTTNTAYAWAPSQLEPQSPIKMTLLGPDGTVQQTASIQYSGHIAQFFTQLFNIASDSFTGSVIIESDKPLYLTVLRLEQLTSGFAITTTPPDPVIQ